MRNHTFYIFLILISTIFPVLGATKDPYHGIYTGKVLLHDCEWAQSLQRKDSRLNTEDKYLIVLYTGRCIDTINTVRDFALFETDLVQNDEVRKGPFNLVSDASFKDSNSFCLSGKKNMKDVVDAVVRHLYSEIDTFVSTYPNLPNSKEAALGNPAADYILQAFHRMYPCHN